MQIWNFNAWVKFIHGKASSRSERRRTPKSKWWIPEAEGRNKKVLISCEFTKWINKIKGIRYVPTFWQSLSVGECVLGKGNLIQWEDKLVDWRLEFEIWQYGGLISTKIGFSWKIEELLQNSIRGERRII